MQLIDLEIVLDHIQRACEAGRKKGRSPFFLFQELIVSAAHHPKYSAVFGTSAEDFGISVIIQKE